jgi:uncharacterized protein YndB with AHSA1/START domain
MAEKSKTVFERPSDRETLFTRVFEAPRALVWRAWTDPERLAKWWGPDGFSITTHGMQFKVGGFWKLTMHGPDGRDYKNEIVYLEIKEPERIVYKHAGKAGNEPVSFQTVVTFEAMDKNSTKLTMRQIFNAPEALEFVIKNYHADKGGVQTINRLGDYLDGGGD